MLKRSGGKMKKFKRIFYTLIILLSLLVLGSCTNDEYNVTFNLGYDNLIYLKQTVKEGNNVAQPDDPKREGYIFLNWDLNDDKFTFERKIKEDISLKAKWSKIYEVQFYLGYGNTFLSKQEVGENKKIIKPNDPLREGYHFLGWFLDDAEFDFNSEIKDDILLAGKWEEEIVDTFVTITFKFNDGNLDPFEQIVLKGKKVNKPINPTKDGYRFLGWFINGLEFDFNNVVNEDILLVAKWELIPIVETFFIVFDSQGGNYTPEMLTVEKNIVIEKPLNPTKDGYLFLGWHYGEQLFDFNEEIEKDYLLIARWLNISENKVFISDFKNLENGSEAIISGVVTSFKAYNYLTIEDESGAIAVFVEGYNTNEIKDLEYKKGNRITLKGLKDVSSGLIIAQTNINHLDKTESVSPLPDTINLTTVNLNDLYNYQAKLVDHDNLTILNIKEIDDKLIFTLFDNEQSIEAIYNTNYLFEEYQSLYGLKIGDIVQIRQALLTWENAAYFALGDKDEIIKIGEVENPNEETNFKIFYLNDTHGAVMNNGNELGLARIGNYMKRTKDENSIFITGGDILQGQLISNANKGALMIEIFNNLELDAFVIGNHEFDWGLDVVLKYFDPDTTGVKADFPILGANVKRKNDDQRPEFIDSHTIITRGDYKIGIVGVIGDGQESSIARQRVDDYYFSNAYTAVKETINEIKNQVDFILVGNHDGDHAFNQKVAELPKVAAIFNGHTHTQYTGYLDEVPYIQSGSSGYAVGQVDLTYSKVNGLTLLHSDAINVSNHPYLNNEDGEVNFIIEGYYNEISHLYTEIIIHASSYLSRDDLTYFAAKLMAKVTGSVFGFQNRGGTRTTINSGPITGSDVFKVFPFDNSIISVNIKGKDLKDLYDGNSHKYLEINYNSINDDALYKVATNDYLFYSTYNAVYFEPVYAEAVPYGDLYETFYNYLVDLKASGQNYFHINSPIAYSNQSLNVFAFYYKNEIQLLN